jgi:hypothetical protein
MTDKRWEFELEGSRHTVELEHNTFTNKRSLRVDGRLLPLDASRQTKERGGVHAFRVEGHPCEVTVSPRGAKYDYDFRLDGVSSVPEKYGLELAEAQNSDEIKGNRWVAIGLFLMIGVGGNWFNWYLAHAKGYYLPELAFLAPAIGFLGIYFIFFPRDFVIQFTRKFPLRMWVALIIAFLLAFANNYAFENGLY